MLQFVKLLANKGKTCFQNFNIFFRLQKRNNLPNLIVLFLLRSVFVSGRMSVKYSRTGWNWVEIVHWNWNHANSLATNRWKGVNMFFVDWGGLFSLGVLNQAFQQGASGYFWKVICLPTYFRIFKSFIDLFNDFLMISVCYLGTHLLNCFEGVVGSSWLFCRIVSLAKINLIFNFSSR